MKKLSKLLVILFIILLIISGIIYIDYYIVKTRESAPRLAIKKKLDDNLTVYNAAFYKVWYCKTNNTYTLGDYQDKDAICPYEYVYDEDGNYENKNGFKISKHDLMLISEYYKNDVIESINSRSELEDAIYVSSNYGKIIDKEAPVSDLKTNDGSSLVVFPEYKKNNDNYEWVYDSEEYYCKNEKGEIALFEEDTCMEYSKVQMDDKWCKLYKKSILIYNDDVKKLCEK